MDKKELKMLEVLARKILTHKPDYLPKKPKNIPLKNN